MIKIKKDSNHLTITQECDCCFISFKATASEGAPEDLSIEIMMRDEDMEKTRAAGLVFFYEEAKAIRDYLNEMIAFSGPHDTQR